MKQNHIILCESQNAQCDEQCTDKKVLFIAKVLLMPAMLKRWQHNYKSRRALAQLDDAHLSDIGLTQAQANEEANKPFWC